MMFANIAGTLDSMNKPLTILLAAVTVVLALILHAWSALALFYCSPIKVVAALLYLGVVGAIGILGRHQPLKGLLNTFPVALGVIAWFLMIEPRSDGVYPPELAMPYAEREGSKVTLHNVRNCVYRTATDFDVRYETRAYNLNELRTLDVMMNYWGMEAVAHTFLAFGFSDGSYLDVSVEIRPEVGKRYDMLQGFFKQYQLIYIWGDERDLIALRTNYKKENVYLYRAKLPPEAVRKMFLSMLEGTNRLYERPQFYNTLTHSCTNTLGDHVVSSGIREIPFWKRRILTGDVDRRLYQAGLLEGSLPFAELRSRASIDERAWQAALDADFSARIRTHLARTP